MGNFSKRPDDVLDASLKKNYVGVHIEQGVPVLDRDLNLMQDIISRTLRSLILRFIGDGVASGSDWFAIQAITANNDFRILAGSVLVNGIDVINGAEINYSYQNGVPPLTTPPATPATRTDSVYLDVSHALVEVSGTQDQDLLNSGDVGLQTSVRQKVVWVVRVAEGATSPPQPADGHTHFFLARLVRTAGAAQIQASMITDLRKQINSLQQLGDGIRILGRPAFITGSNQFTPTRARPEINITLLGKNFALGGLKVRFDRTDAPGSSYATVASGPTDTGVEVAQPRMPALIPGKSYKITVETNFGTTTSDIEFTALP